MMHGDHVDLVYFWSAIVIVLLPVTAFGAIGYWLVKMYRRERNQH
jgi:lipopolysaccharide export LptBFGC system permease protein LptF